VQNTANLPNVDGKSWWLHHTGAILGFLRGLEKSTLSDLEKSDLRTMLIAAWDRHFPDDEDNEFPYGYKGGEKQQPDLGKKLRIVLTQPAGRMAFLIEKGAEWGSPDIISCAAQRWISLNPAAGPQILQALGKMRFPEEETQRANFTEQVTKHFFRYWAMRDASAAIKAMGSASEKFRVGARQGLIPFVSADARNEWLQDSPNRVRSYFIAWSEIAPKDALPVAAHLSSGWVTECLVPSYYMASKPFSEQVEALMPYLDREKTTNYGLGSLALESWGAHDSELAVSAGLACVLRNGPATKAKFIKGWTNKEFIEDGGLEDRLYGNLRYWACTQPTAMAGWIAKQPDAEVRNALTWLLKNAKGVPWPAG
jgi:hypothetical protein